MLAYTLPNSVTTTFSSSTGHPCDSRMATSTTTTTGGGWSTGGGSRRNAVASEHQPTLRFPQSAEALRDLAAAEQVAASLRRRSKARLHEPMADVAARLGWPVVVDEDLERPGLVFDGTIYVQAGYQPRVDFTIAHELMEAHLPKQIRCEATCNRGAAAMLLPWRTYLRDLLRHQLDLPALKRSYPRASFSALARRLADLSPGAAVTKWSEGKVMWRHSLLAQDVSETERTAVSKLMETTTCARAMVHSAGVLALAWTLRRRPLCIISLAVAHQ